MGMNMASFFNKLVNMIQYLPWIEVLVDLWKVGSKVFRGLSFEGMYEVLEYESTLELKDGKGKQALFWKREKVRYLQDNIIAYQDQAWGDGQILVDYQCTPGRPVDIYRLGHKWHVLISRREVKSKDEEDIYHTTWKINDGFLKPTGYWETHITHPTQRAEINVILPVSRHPKHICFLENNRRRSRQVPGDNRSTLPDGRHRIHWRIDCPRLYENYVIQWEW